MLGVLRLQVFLLCHSGKNSQPERVNPGCLESIVDFLQRGLDYDVANI